MNAKRRLKEAQVPDRPAADAQQELFWRDLLPVLDQELAALPDKYRAPIILCDLEGKSRKDAAHQLGWPEGPLSSRLALGRRRLAERLNRRGITRSQQTVPLAVPNGMAPVSPLLLATTVQLGVLVATGAALVEAGASATVAALTDGVLKSMLVAKLKVAATVAVALVVAGLGFVADRSQHALPRSSSDGHPAAAAEWLSPLSAPATPPAYVLATQTAPVEGPAGGHACCCGERNARAEIPAVAIIFLVGSDDPPRPRDGGNPVAISILAVSGRAIWIRLDGPAG